MKILEFIKNIFKKKEFDVKEFIKESEDNLQKKLDIIYKTDWYKKQKEEIYGEYEDFKEEHKELIGKYFGSDFGYFKIIKVKEPWFLKSPILIDSANFYWKFDESFEIESFDNNNFSEVSLEDLKYAWEVKKDSIKIMVDKF